MRGERPQPASKHDKLRQRLRDRLTLNNIHSEIQLISSMNKHLEISVEALMRLDILLDLPKEEVIGIVQGIAFIKYVKKSERTQRECFRLQYENSNRILLLTGIQVQFIENILTQFNNYSRRYGDLQKVKGTLARITMNTPFWVGIEAVNEEAANALKKFLRNEKRNLDQINKKVEYKVENRRIRIIIVKEDLFTLLVDAMTEYKAILFNKQFQFGPVPIDRSKIEGCVVYRPIIYNNAQSYSYRTESREEELSDGFSESNSLNSDLFDPNKIKDIIETSDQGIQSQNNTSTSVIPIQEQPFHSEHPRCQNSPSKSPKELQHTPQQPQTEGQQRQHEKQIILKSQIIRNNQDQFGLCQEEVERQYESPRKNGRILETYDVCTEKISPIYHRHQVKNQQLIINPTKISLTFDSGVQTQQPLYNVIPDHLMRKCLQQFKSKPHSQLTELPEWLKSQSQNERNRHRFFSSLCKPKLIHRHQPF